MTVIAPSRPVTDDRLWHRLTGPVKLLLLTQLAFNIGFYLVVPFLATYLEDDLHLAGWLIGVILGLRTFSQQGLFLVGGAIADSMGIKRSIVAGCLIRISGFVLLGLATGLGWVIAGVVLIGLAAALFSPATESAIAAWGGELERSGGPARTQVLALESVFSRVGSVVGPLLGGVLLVVPFRTTCLVAAAIFGLILLAHLRWLPKGARAGESTRMVDSLTVVLRNRRFLVFALLHSTYLLTYTMLYLALPVELQRIGAPAAAITWYFVLAAVLTICLQVPVTRATRTWSPQRSLSVGFALLALCFVPVAAVASWPPAPGAAAHVAPVLMVVLLDLGAMLSLPVARDLVARLAHERHLGAHLGALSTMGGVTVLIGSTVAGALLDLARTPTPWAWLPWLVLALLPGASALLLPATLRRRARPGAG